MKTNIIRPRRNDVILFIVMFYAFMTPRFCFAQQDPVYAQYINNPLVLNPAYAGSNNMFNANLQYRTQWAGLDANPTTINFNSHLSVFQNKIGLGFMVIEDKIGENKNMEINTIYSYKIKLKDAWLSFGMQTGFIRYTNNPAALVIRDPGDPVFGTYSETKFNTGAGIILKSPRYMIGLSVPKLIPMSVSSGGQIIQTGKQTFYFFGSYMMLISQDLKFRPSVLARSTQGSPVSFDFNATLAFKDNLAAGLFTRNLNTYGLLVNVLVEKFRFGYVFELPGSPASSLNFTTHEVTLGISLAILNPHDKYPTLY